MKHINEIKLEEWKAMGYQCYPPNREELKQAALTSPNWIHFGAGNIFRAYPAKLAQDLWSQGKLNSGIIVAEGYDFEIMDRVYTTYDNHSILAILKKDKTIEKSVLGSVVESLCLRQDHQDFLRLKEIFKCPSLQMASFTITEKGYQIQGNPQVELDFEKGPHHTISYIGNITSLLVERYQANALPIAMVSMDNCSHNGEKLQQAITSFAKAWIKAGYIDTGFLAYIENSDKVSFPWTMIDKITPRPSGQVLEVLCKDGLAGMEPVETSKGTYVAPFVNAEETGYLVIEDAFPNGRPPLEDCGVYFTSREIVEKVERMKVCTCLNPLHTALAIFGCLLGYQTIYECMQDAALKKLVERIGYQEGMPVVSNPEIIDPHVFLHEVLEERFVNPFIPDTPQRIACDTSMKLGIRFGETIKAYEQSDTLSVSSLRYIPFVFAGWCRYLMGVDEQGNAFTCSHDPMLDTLMPYLQHVRLGKDCNVHEVVYPILSNQDIFQVDLYALGLGNLVETYFKDMIQGTGAIRETLQNLLAKEEN